MKIFNLVSNIVIIIAFVLMWVFHPKAEDKTMDAVAAVEAGQLPVAYVNLDSLLMNYQKAIDLNEELMSQQEAARTDLTAKARKLEEDMMAFQRKIENNGFLTRERAESEQKRILGIQQNLEQEQQRVSNELLLKQQDLNDAVLGSINDFIKEYNEEAKFEIIFTQNSEVGTILLAGSAYNITQEVLTGLNKAYADK